MTIEARAAGFCKGVGSFAIMFVLSAIPTALIFGASWVRGEISPWLEPTFSWTLIISLIILAPSAIFPKTRGFSAAGFMLASTVFSIVCRVSCLLVTLELLGFWAVIVGLLFFGLSIVPVAILAAAFHANWAYAGIIMLMAITAIGARVISQWLAKRA